MRTEGIANRRRLNGLVAEVEKVSRQAAEILLAEPPSPPQAASAGSPTAGPGPGSHCE